jgi:hypothetical protein
MIILLWYIPSLIPITSLTIYFTEQLSDLMISTQITTKLFAALVLGQCEHVPSTLEIAADATVASATPDVPHAGIIARDEFFSSHYKVFGPSSEADIAALEAGTSQLRVRLPLY